MVYVYVEPIQAAEVAENLCAKRAYRRSSKLLCVTFTTMYVHM